MTRVRVDPSALRAFLASDEVHDLIDHVGELVEREAERLAPRDPSSARHGAEPGIARDTVLTGDGWESHVGHRVGKGAFGFYLIFHEFGTARLSPRPHLRPAARRRYTL